MSAPDSVTIRVKGVLIATLHLEMAVDDLADDEVLFGGGMALDSIASLEIIAALETEFGLEVPDEDLVPELFDSVATLVQYVESRRAEAPVSEG